MVNPNPTVQVLAASAARTANLDILIENHPYKSGIILLIDVTAEVLTAIFTPEIAVEDGNGDYINIWVAAAVIDAVGNFSYILTPNMLATGAALLATEKVQLQLPPAFRLRMNESGGGDALTFSIQALWLP